MPFLSIQLNSNRPLQIARFFDSIEATADAPADIEVLLHIDMGDTAMEAAIAEDQQKRLFSLKVYKTSLISGYGTLWKPLNLLVEHTHPDAAFLLNVSDEMLFETKGWDTVVKSYVGFFPDGIFRLRASQFRFRNYSDVWECGFAPDSIAFYSKRWLELSAGWCPCLGPDSFQQCVAYYMYSPTPFLPQQFNRDIPLPFLKFSGEGQAVGLTGEARWKRVCVNIRAWFTLMSHTMQQEAKRCAMRMQCHADAHPLGTDAEILDNAARQIFTLRDVQTGETTHYPYQLSRLRVILRNVSRAPFLLYYNGSRLPKTHYTLKDNLVTIAASCGLGVAACLPLSLGGKLLAAFERRIKRL